MTVFLCGGIENDVGKGKNAGFQHFLVFPQSFPKSFSRSLKVCGKELTAFFLFPIVKKKKTLDF